MGQQQQIQQLQQQQKQQQEQQEQKEDCKEEEQPDDDQQEQTCAYGAEAPTEDNPAATCGSRIGILETRDKKPKAAAEAEICQAEPVRCGTCCPKQVPGGGANLADALAIAAAAAAGEAA